VESPSKNTDERLFTVEVGKYVIENATLDEIRAFLEKKVKRYNTNLLFRLLEDDYPVNRVVHLPGLTKKGFQNYWWTSYEKYDRNSILCRFRRTK